MDIHTALIMRFSIFAALHSVLAVPYIKVRIMQLTHCSRSEYRLGYNILALLSFGWVMSTGQQSAILFEILGVGRYILYLIQIIMLIALVSCLYSTGLTSFLGLDALSASKETSQPLATKGWYGTVRHPLYFLSILFMFSNPVMTERWMLFSCMSTLYFVVGALIEEKRLQKEFGEEYNRYRERVPFILPLPRNRHSAH